MMRTRRRSKQYTYVEDEEEEEEEEEEEQAERPGRRGFLEFRVRNDAVGSPANALSTLMVHQLFAGLVETIPLGGSGCSKRNSGDDHDRTSTDAPSRCCAKCQGGLRRPPAEAIMVNSPDIIWAQPQAPST